ncbi:MBOAT family O-acyltransferase [Terasakiella pusilla]|uniref:MBOAT family O-acyltransferase n=1 Tax=Terasakiella pusilla TaxID=64973 RepID=UPI003AA7C701
MLFQLPSFLIFLSVFILILMVMPQRYKKHYAFAASILFYSFWYLPYTFILLGLIVFGWGACQILSRQSGKLGLLVFLSLLPLCYYKYTEFLLTVFVGDDHGFSVMLPLGISFVTFTLISMMIDLVRANAKPASFLDVGLFISFFPQLVAGPILRTAQMMPQLDFLKVRGQAILYNLPLFATGMVKKVLIGDTIARYIDPIFANPSDYDTTTLALAAFGFAVQIYCDFSAYSDMAIASAGMVGIKLPQNFNSPYLAYSMGGLWRRWHMTLSFWIKDYLYLPLKKINIYLAFLTAMTLSGIWHGAAWTFVVFGTVVGFWLCMEYAVDYEKRMTKTKAGRVTAVILNFIFWSLLLILFRAESLSTAMVFYQGILASNWQGIASDQFVVIGLIVFTLAVHPFDQVDKVRNALAQKTMHLVIPISIGVILACSFLAAAQPQNFYYFEF